MPKSTEERDQLEAVTPDEATDERSAAGDTTQSQTAETDLGRTAIADSPEIDGPAAETPGGKGAGRWGRRRGRGTRVARATAVEKGSEVEERPSLKKRKSGEPEAVTADAASTAAAGTTGRRKRGRVTTSRLAQVITALLVVAVLLAVLLLVQLIKGPGNGGKLGAQEDRGEAAQQAATTVIPKLYSYDYRQIDQNVTQQQQLTVGTINDQIRTETGPALKSLAPKAKAVVQAVSVDSAVLDATGPDVQVLVFLNQAVNSNLLPAPRLDRNRVVVTMRLVDGQWKVADIKAL